MRTRSTGCVSKNDEQLPPQSPRGFTILELSVVLGIVSLIAGLTLMAFGNMKGSVQRRNFAADLTGGLGQARARALARQRTQMVVIDAIAGANNTYGYYHFEDNANPPNIFSATDLTAILGALDPSRPITAPAPYVLRSIDSNYDVATEYLSATSAWSGALPFPFGSVSINTSGGCSFCSAGTGAVAFLPNGKAIFSDGNVVGGLIMLQSHRADGSLTGTTGVAISPTGFFQKLVPR